MKKKKILYFFEPPLNFPQNVIEIFLWETFHAAQRGQGQNVCMCECLQCAFATIC